MGGIAKSQAADSPATPAALDGTKGTSCPAAVYLINA
jgi:hypothetical protein